LAVFEVTAVLPAAAVQWQRSRQAAARLVALLPAPPAREGGSGPERRGQGGALLELRGVAAGWPGHEAVVRGVDLITRPGEVTALTGPSGVGKTTVLMTAAGLLPAHSGTVRRGGKALFVAEDGHVFHTSVLENLRVARGDLTAAEAREALGAVGLEGWLAALPDGLDTVLSADARNLSGGQRRRLLIARALLSRAEVLLVDEPGEHLDGPAADAIGHALRRYAERRPAAVVLATHRAAEAAAADAAVRLEVGGRTPRVAGLGPAGGTFGADESTSAKEEPPPWSG
ncbi:MAG: ATP-binding cassette domain-containing protein, partial [Promicromonosporaceae bacterium]|nr:ATP-binding cassette domain-containing protein [Promicromonosporaceae bacterium]